MAVVHSTVVDLWLAGDHIVGKLSAMSQTGRSTQPSISV